MSAEVTVLHRFEGLKQIHSQDHLIISVGTVSKNVFKQG
jgi:hypothetical protein